MTWYKFYVKDDIIDLQRNVRVRVEFANAQVAAGAPPGLNLFENVNEPIGGCTYFAPYHKHSPQWNDLLARYGATVCDLPEGSTIKPVIGGGDAWNLWFGNKTS
jgi:hypothetical protein